MMFSFRNPNSKGLSHMKKEEYQKAIAEFEQVIVKYPDNWETYGYLGYTYRILGNNDRAIETFQKCLSINSEAIESHQGLALSFADKGIKFDEAVTLIEKTKEILKEDSFIFESSKGLYFEALSWIYFRQGKIEKAIEYFDKAYPIWQNDFRRGVDEFDLHFSETHYHFGVILAYKGEKEKAIEEFEKALKCSKLSIFAKNSLYEMEKLK